MHGSVCRIREPCFPFPSQRNKKPPYFIPGCYSLYHFEVAGAMLVPSIGDLIRLKSGDSLGPKYNECTQTSHNGKLGVSKPGTKGQQHKSSCAFPHVTARGLKARTSLESVATRAVSQDVCAFLLAYQCLMHKLI